MKLTYIIISALIASSIFIALPGCEKGNAEKVGASIDNAVEKSGDQIKKTGDAIKQSVNNNKRGSDNERNN
jgi:hypothetical protein